MLPERIEAGALELRRAGEDSVDDMLEAVLSSLAELRVWMRWAHEAPTRAGLREILRDFRVAFERGEGWDYGVWDAATGTYVGSIRLHLVAPEIGSIGYWVRSSHHRRGHATTAVEALTRAAFDAMPEVEQIEIHMDQANVASTGVARAAGYRLDREEEREVLTPGHTGRGWVWTVDRPR